MMKRGCIVRQRKWNSELVISEVSESPSANFKSSYAKEVVQDVRQNPQDSHYVPGRFSHPGALYQSHMNLRQEVFSNGGDAKNIQQRSLSICDVRSALRKNAQVQAEFGESNDSLAWMSATTFKRILDRQEEAEGIGPCKGCESVQAEVRNADFGSSRKDQEWTNARCLVDDAQNPKGSSIPLNKSKKEDLEEGNEDYKVECQILRRKNRDVLEDYNRLKSQLRTQEYYEKEIEHLKWQLKAMEKGRQTYETATLRLMFFLDQVSMVLQSTSPGYRKLVESTRAEVSALTRKAKAGNKMFSSSSLEEKSDSLKNSKMKRSTSTNARIGLPSLGEESVSNDSSLFSDSRREHYLSTPPLPPKNPKVHYENIEVFESLYKDPSYVQEWISAENSKNKDSKAEIMNRQKIKDENDTTVKFEREKRRRSLKRGSALKAQLYSSTISEGKDGMKYKTHHKLMRSMKWILAKEKTLVITPQGKCLKKKLTADLVHKTETENAMLEESN